MKPNFLSPNLGLLPLCLFLSISIFLFNDVNSQSILCAGNLFNTNAIFNSNGNCTGGVTYRITSSSVQGIANTTSANATYTPTSAGTFTLEAWQGGTMCHSELFNVVDIQATATGACFEYDISIAGNLGACTVDYVIDGNTVNDVNNVIDNYNFGEGGPQTVVATVTCGADVCNVSRTIIVNGPSANFNIFHDQNSNNVSELSEALNPVDYNGNENTYTICVGQGGAPSGFDWIIGGASQVFANGVATGASVQYNVTYSNGALNQNITGSTLNMNILDPNDGFANLNYQITGGGCTTNGVVSLYMAEIPANIGGGVAASGVWPQEAFCLGDPISFAITPNANNPAGTRIFFAITCGSPVSPTDANVVFLEEVTNQIVNNSPITFDWISTRNSCGCNTPSTQNTLTASIFYQNPCFPVPVGSGTFPVTVAFSDELETSSAPNLCVGATHTFQALGLTNVNNSFTVDCSPEIRFTLYSLPSLTVITQTNWAVVNTSNSPNRNFPYTFTTAGNYRLCVESRVNCAGGVPSESCQDFCVSENRVVTPNFGINPNDLISGTVTQNPVVCLGATVNPGYFLSGNFSCSPNIVTWTVSPNGNGAIASGVTSNITPTDTAFTFSAIGTYRLRYNAVGNCLASTTGFIDIVVGQPPSIIVNAPSSTFCAGDIVNLDPFFCISENGIPISNMVLEFKQGLDSGCDDLTGYTSIFSGIPNTSVVSPCGGANTYSWTVPSGASGTYTFRVRAQNGCGTAQACFQINIGVPTTFSSPFPSAVCQGSTIQLSNYSPSATGCTWQYLNGSNWINLIPVGNIVNSLPVNSSTTFRVSCSGFCPLQATVNVIPPFTVSLNASQNPVCSNSPITINATTSPANITISSYNFTGPLGSQSSSSSSFNIASVNSGGVVTVVATDNNNCTSSANLTVTLSQGPSLSTTSINRCETDLSPINLNQLLQASSGGFVTNATWVLSDASGQSWSVPSNQTTLTAANIIQQFGAIQVPNEIFTLSYSFINSSNCTFTGSAAINIQAQTQSTVDANICANSAISIPSTTGQLTWLNAPPSAASPVVGQTYSWTPQPSDVSPTPYVLQSVSQCALVNTNYTVRYIDLNINAVADTICAGNDAIIEASVNPAGTYTYEWCSGLNCTAFSSGAFMFTANSIQSTTSFSARVSDSFCSYIESIVIHVDESPMENNQLLDNPYCEVSPGEIILLDALLTEGSGSSITSANWQLCNSSISSNSLTVAEIIDAGLCGPVSNGIANYILTYEYTSEYCTYTGDFTIEILNQTEQEVPIVFCAGELITFGQTGDWSDNGTLPASAPTDCSSCSYAWQTTLSDVVSDALLRVTDNANCSAIDYLIDINPTPVVSATAIAEICVNEEVSFDASSDQTLTSSVWSANGITMTGNTFSPAALGFASGATIDICFSGENQFGCSNQDCFEIAILGLPSNTVLDDDGLHCIDQSLQLPNASGYNYTVDFTLDSNTLEYQEGQTVMFPENGFWGYEIIATTSAGCSDIQQGQLQVLTVPLADINLEEYNSCAPIITIQNNSVGDNSTYSWTSTLLNSPLNTFDFSPNPLIVPATPIDAFYPIIFEVTSICGTSQDAIEVYFQAPPTAFLSSTFESGFNCAPICGVIDVDCPSTNTVDQITYTWNGLIDSNTGQSSIEATSLDFLPNVCFDVQSAVETVITVEVENACGSASDTLPLIVIPPQVAADFVIEESVCPGSQVLIIDQSFPEVGATVTYSVSPQGQGVFISNGVINVLESAESGIYQITQLVEGCGSDFLSLNLEVFENIDIDVSMTSTTSCVGVPVSFEASLSDFQEIVWNFGDGLEQIGYTTIEHLFFESGTYPVTASVITSDGCSSADILNVTVSGNDIFILSEDSILCDNRFFRGIPSSNQFETIVWGISPTPLPFEVSYLGEEFEYRFLNNSDEIEEYVLSLTSFNAQGCGSYDEMVIKVKPATTVNLRWKEDPICYLPEELTIVIEDYNIDWEYYFESADTLVQSAAEIQGIFNSSQEITVFANNEFACPSLDMIELNCEGIEVFIPNTVTPDGDDTNEVFQPVMYKEPFEYELRIYNRWGDCIFETTDWQKPWEVNSHEGGYYVPDGLYHWDLVYKSSVKSDPITKQGIVFVVR